MIYIFKHESMINTSCTSKEWVEQLSKTILFLKAVSDETRLQIICFLKKDTKCVCDIVAFLDLPQNLVSHHLKTLKQQNIVSSEKQWLKVYYTLNYETINQNISFFNSLI